MVKRLLRWTLAAAAAGFAAFAYLYLSLPDVRALRKENPPTTAFMELRAREADKAGKKPRKVQRWVPYERISPSLKRAVIVSEDAAFFSHEGVDFDELEKSFEDSWSKGKRMRGGSTITQQLAKNLYLSPSRSPVRKIEELMIARRLEAELSKRRILELYLNVIEWGDGIWGAEAAARSYFQKPASALAADESALLAAAIINPRRYSPARPSKYLLRRQDLIRQRMGDVEPPAPGRGAGRPRRSAVSSRTGVGGAIAAALIVAGLSGGPRAASVIAPTFDAMVARAQVVFVGETLDVRSRWESTPSGRAIVSVVTFKVIRTLKGELGGQTQLEFLGGTVGDYRMEIPGMPRFRVGDEDVLFVDERGQPVSPVVGFMHGRFRVLEDPVTRRRSVARHNFEPLASVRDIGAATAPARVSSARALTLEAFEGEIAREIRRQREAR